jgi:hypothetical protein
MAKKVNKAVEPKQRGRKTDTAKKDKMVLAYAKLCKLLGKYPSRIEFCDGTEYTKDMLAHYHSSLGELKKKAKEKYPEYFTGVLNESIFHPKALRELNSVIRGAKRFVVTTAVTGCPVDKNFMGAIQTYCKEMNAELLVLIASDPAARASKDFIDSAIPSSAIVVDDVSINENIHLNTIKLSAKHIDPITSLTRIGHRQGGFIYASPKQRLKFMPTARVQYTHAIMTTGAITAPNYGTDKYMSDRTAHIAEHDHVMGAVIVEIKDKKKYFFRQIQADTDGSFVDLGVKYDKLGSEEYLPEAFVLGDWHSGETDPVARRCWEEVCKLLKPKYLVLHDAFNGLSINHHEEYNTILLAQRAMEGKLDLQREMKDLAKDITDLSKLVDEIIMVKSNHDEFLTRYLQDGKYVKDPINHRYALDLAKAMLDGEDPLKFALSNACNVSKVKFLIRDENFMVGGVQLGAHGDKGSNGARGGIKSLESAYGNSVTGHSHSPEILRGAWVVGTSSLLRLSYNVGPSSWMHTSCLVYPNGARQLISVIDGKWRLE